MHTADVPRRFQVHCLALSAYLALYLLSVWLKYGWDRHKDNFFLYVFIQLEYISVGVWCFFAHLLLLIVHYKMYALREQLLHLYCRYFRIFIEFSYFYIILFPLIFCRYANIIFQAFFLRCTHIFDTWTRLYRYHMHIFRFIHATSITYVSPV